MSTCFRLRWVRPLSQTASALGMLLGATLGTLAAAQTFDRPAPPPYLEIYPGRIDGGVPGVWQSGPPGVPYEGLRTDGYPSNRNLNLDDRSPRLGPTLPQRREAAPADRPGNGVPDWGSMHQQPDVRRGDGAMPRRQ